MGSSLQNEMTFSVPHPRRQPKTLQLPADRAQHARGRARTAPYKRRGIGTASGIFVYGLSLSGIAGRTKRGLSRGSRLRQQPQRRLRAARAAMLCRMGATG